MADLTQADIDAAVAKAVGPLQDSVTALETKRDELIADLRKARKAGEIKPEDLQAAEDRADKAEAALATATKDLKALTKERDDAKTSLETEQAFTQRLLIQDGLKSALIANGVKDEDFIDSLTAKFAGAATVATEGDARVAKIGDKPLADHIKTWAESDAGKKFVSAPFNSGGGAEGNRGGGGGNAKTVTRAQFDSLSVEDRMTFAKDGGKVVDQAA